MKIDLASLRDYGFIVHPKFILKTINFNKDFIRIFKDEKKCIDVKVDRIKPKTDNENDLLDIE